ncbi:saccharopine dehydrogenase NADP-binding domain-containing protein [Gordonia sp. HY002]|uniref:NAD(P)H-binding protein n=1 Tax=Gordonia zhenghanii TaxID=2911516 RepID=UPI001EEFE91C|nr:NAD(P)H-binding protein [Gordonia zhenghanii]MCF8572246.1 saccharopine dehydrogenase NADP-binding domain-containing protein [Gordonia zhenghanii]MCF8605076.1 saccharopine dehydrogenase NADP-binding domain-containing protein [Gordonia zhenghanii]
MATPVGRAILLGATGYTGKLVLTALRQYDMPLTLVGRNVRELRLLAERHGPGIDVVYGDASRAASLPRFHDTDVVISTVGPFTRVGLAVADAAIESGAAYLDSTGEPPFIRTLFESRSAAATRRGATVVPAFGYDYTPGAVAASAAITQAPTATHVRIGYFLTDDTGKQIPFRRLTRATTPGTRESLARVISEQSFAFRGTSAPFGTTTERNGTQLLKFQDHEGRTVRALSVGGAEHFTVPEAHPGIETVDVGLGWLGRATTPLHALTRLLGPTATSQPAKALTDTASTHLPWQQHVPSGGVCSLIIAEATDARGRLLARSTFTGTEPYEFTGRLLAWGANEFLTNSPRRPPGVVGPLIGFGIDRVTKGVEHAGIRSRP